MMCDEKEYSIYKFLTKLQITFIVVLFIIIFLGQFLIQLSKNEVKYKLIGVISNNKTNNYFFMDHYYSNITKVVQLSTFGDQQDYEQLKNKNLQLCYSLNILQYMENGQSKKRMDIPLLKQKFYDFKQKSVHKTKPYKIQNNFIQIYQIDCRDLKIYINHKKMILQLLEQVFELIYPLKILSEIQNQNKQLKQEIYFNFDINQKHTMNINNYLRTRFSFLIWILILNQQISISVDIFIGNPTDLAYYYNSTKLLKINNQGSYKYYLQQNDKNYKLIVSGISNVQRLNNFFYILKFSKIDFQKVSLIGKVQDYQQLNSKLLNDQLYELDIHPQIVYLGNRKQALLEIAKKLYIDELRYITDNFEEYAISLLKIRNQLLTKSVNGVFRYSYLIMDQNGRDIGIIFFRMPNGELAYEATKALLELGVKYFFMVGAGGAINPNLSIGNYIQIIKSQYNSELISINTNKLIDLIDFSVVYDGENITIDSPLEETQNWLFNNRNMDCVDIETFHIFKALQESPGEVKYLTGIFISDVISQQPLQNKIGIDNAYRSFSNFMQSSFIYLKL